MRNISPQKTFWLVWKPKMFSGGGFGPSFRWSSVGGQQDPQEWKDWPPVGLNHACCQESDGLVHRLQHHFFFFLLSFHLPDSCRTPEAIVSSSSQWVVVLVLVLVLTRLYLQQDMKTYLSACVLSWCCCSSYQCVQCSMFSKAARVVICPPALKDRTFDAFFLKNFTRCSVLSNAFMLAIRLSAGTFCTKAKLKAVGDSERTETFVLALCFRSSGDLFS